MKDIEGGMKVMETTLDDGRERLSQREVLSQDMRFTFRMLRKNPQFAVITLLILALGIGANTAIFSLIEGVLLRPLDYRDSERLFAIREIVPSLAHLYPTLPANARHFAEWQKECSSFEEMAQMNRGSVSLTGQGEPERIASSSVSWNFFQVLGVQPRVGRLFLPEEDQPNRNDVVILSDSLWNRRFRGDPSVLNSKILIDGKPYVVIGILPPRFRYPEVVASARSDTSPEIFEPLGLDLESIPDLGDFDNEVIARMRQGVTPEQAFAEMNTVQAQIASRISGDLELRTNMNPSTIASALRSVIWQVDNQVPLTHVQAMKELVEDSVAQRRFQLGLVLLFALTALLLAGIGIYGVVSESVSSRVNEIGIRMALGADTGNISRLVLREGMKPVLAGMVLGVTASLIIGRVLNTLLFEVKANDPVILIGSGLIMILVAVAACYLPARRASRVDPIVALRYE